MAKYYGNLGFVEMVTTSPGVTEEVVTERPYYGDILKNIRRWESNGEQLNDNLNVQNRFSVLADAYALHHFFELRYIWWQGSRWKVTSVEVDEHRLILTIGGVYNGPTTVTTET